MKLQQRRVTTGLLLLILLLALALRFYGLDAQSLWNDEGTSVAVAQRSLGTIARDAAQDIHPPLYYWLLAGWVRLLGTTELAVRSLSALLGVVLVLLTYMLGKEMAGRRVGLVAAFMAAVHPFQVYYAQEARMYMLLAVLTAGTVMALVRFVERKSWRALVALVLLEAAGLYTHYSFAFVALVVNLAYALWLPQIRRNGFVVRRGLIWLAAQLSVMLLYLPWLPLAIRQVTTWPSPEQSAPLFPALAETWRWLVLGPVAVENGQSVALLVALFATLAGTGSLLAGWIGTDQGKARWDSGLLLLWGGLPVVLMFVLGLYRVAYLKFLLVTTPALGVLWACGLTCRWPSLSRPLKRGLQVVQAMAALAILIPSVLVLSSYYVEPAYARDDYRSIAAYIEAIGRDGDAILLNAPGQQEVFAYYYQGDLPLYPLPQRRPLDPAETESALAEMVQPGGRVFAVLWATDESDPGRFVEGWLDSHTYKAFDSWYGNVRLVVYAVPQRLPGEPERALNVSLRNPETGDEIVLAGYSLLTDQLSAGDIAQITLFWLVDRVPTRRYKVFVHVLDEGNHIVGQRDAEPGGGVQLTTLWEPGKQMADNYGVPLHPATPPGHYRVEVGMYDPETGQRLITNEGDSQVWLEPLSLDRPLASVPPAALQIDHTANAEFGELILLGYDMHNLGMAHLPDAPIQAGGILHANLYWQAGGPLDGDWRVEIALVDAEGRDLVRVDADLVGGYPTSLWQTGDVWRGQFNLAVPSETSPGRYRLRIHPVTPDGTAFEAFLSDVLYVGK